MSKYDKKRFKKPRNHSQYDYLKKRDLLIK